MTNQNQLMETERLRRWLETMTIQVERLTRERDEARAALTRWGDVGAYHSLRQANDRAEAAEARVASLTEQLAALMGTARDDKP